MMNEGRITSDILLPEIEIDCIVWNGECLEVTFIFIIMIWFVFFDSKESIARLIRLYCGN